MERRCSQVRNNGVWYASREGALGHATGSSGRGNGASLNSGPTRALARLGREYVSTRNCSTVVPSGLSGVEMRPVLSARLGTVFREFPTQDAVDYEAGMGGYEGGTMVRICFVLCGGERGTTIGSRLTSGKGRKERLNGWYSPPIIVCSSCHCSQTRDSTTKTAGIDTAQCPRTSSTYAAWKSKHVSQPAKRRGPQSTASLPCAALLAPARRRRQSTLPTSSPQPQ